MSTPTAANRWWKTRGQEIFMGLTILGRKAPRPLSLSIQSRTGVYGLLHLNSLMYSFAKAWKRSTPTLLWSSFSSANPFSYGTELRRPRERRAKHEYSTHEIQGIYELEACRVPACAQPPPPRLYRTVAWRSSLHGSTQPRSSTTLSSPKGVRPLSTQARIRFGCNT